jgi:hypothetical protein
MSLHLSPETEQVKAKLHTNWNDLLNHARKLERERDEARQEAQRFRSLHYSHLGINGSASAFPWEGK